MNFVVPRNLAPSSSNPIPSDVPCMDLCVRIATRRRFGAYPSDGGHSTRGETIKMKAAKPMNVWDGEDGAVCTATGLWYPFRMVVWVDGKPYGSDVAARLFGHMVDRPIKII